MTDPWIPYEGETPAFQVQRPFFSDVEGGDYVRGGSAGKPKAAVRYRLLVPDSQTLATQSTLVTIVKSYSSIDVTWGWPPRFDTWDEVALVRSGFGHPSTVNDGVTLFRSTRTDYSFVDADNEPLSIVITDDDLPSGRWYYYGLFFYAGSVWLPALQASALVPRNFGHRDHLWEALPPYYQWVDSRFRSSDGYLHQFLNTFGFELDLTREYVESWQETYHADFSPIQLLKRVGENLGLSNEEGLGEIRYRALVGQLSELYQRRGTAEGIRELIEVSSKYETLITEGRNMMLLPDDSDFRTGPGNWVLGTGVGGTYMPTAGLSVATGAAFDAVVTLSNARMARADLAAGVGGAFNGLISIQGTSGPISVSAVTATGSGAAFSATTIRPVVLEAPYVTDDRTAGYGRGVLHVSAPVEFGTGDVIVTAGLGTMFLPGMKEPKQLTPKFNGIPIKTGNLYGFSVQYKGPTTGSAGIYWFDKNEAFVASVEQLFPSPGAWQALTVQGEPPANAVYAVPYVRQNSRTAGDGFNVMGAMFYRVGDVGSVAALSPDFYLTLGSGDELIGTGTAANRVIGDA